MRCHRQLLPAAGAGAGAPGTRCVGVSCSSPYAARREGATDRPRPGAGLRVRPSCPAGETARASGPCADAGTAPLQTVFGGQCCNDKDHRVLNAPHLPAHSTTASQQYPPGRTEAGDTGQRSGRCHRPCSCWPREVQGPRARGGLRVPCTTKFTACRSAWARSCWPRARILGSGLLLPMMDVT